jgi:hypothetical protein
MPFHADVYCKEVGIGRVGYSNVNQFFTESSDRASEVATVRVEWIICELSVTGPDIGGGKGYAHLHHRLR